MEVDFFVQVGSMIRVERLPQLFEHFIAISIFYNIIYYTRSSLAILQPPDIISRFRETPEKDMKHVKCIGKMYRNKYIEQMCTDKCIWNTNMYGQIET